MLYVEQCNVMLSFWIRLFFTCDALPCVRDDMQPIIPLLTLATSGPGLGDLGRSAVRTNKCRFWKQNNWNCMRWSRLLKCDWCVRVTYAHRLSFRQHCQTPVGSAVFSLDQDPQWQCPRSHFWCTPAHLGGREVDFGGEPLGLEQCRTDASLCSRENLCKMQPSKWQWSVPVSASWLWTCRQYAAFDCQWAALICSAHPWPLPNGQELPQHRPRSLLHWFWSWAALLKRHWSASSCAEVWTKIPNFCMAGPTKAMLQPSWP